MNKTEKAITLIIISFDLIIYSLIIQLGNLVKINFNVVEGYSSNVFSYVSIISTIVFIFVLFLPFLFFKSKNDTNKN
ncbi:hypothetical protein RBU61_16925 [Tissierella sp. MB52-C2]|uniref:hypothetical protein n=1 Tax=Tissierella sp. MB52-C2 TaxID=3070999 RepID=UPI00280AE732|nr:hypothetical protein [Tissierella sp. MB52-C2]WMM24594.1 hypothetical protein RBU61_16925 [Tissierella sp. MB52-C2]